MILKCIQIDLQQNFGNIKDYQFQSTFLWEWQKKTDLGNLSHQGMFDFLNIFINLFPCRNLVKLDLSYNVNS